MKKFALFFLMFNFWVVTAFAQFPTFYPTYKQNFKLEKEKLFYSDELNLALEDFLKTLGKQELSIDVRSAFSIKKLLDKQDSILLAKIKSLEQKINLLEPKAQFSNVLKESIGYQDSIIELQAERRSIQFQSDFLYSINTFYGTPGVPARFIPVKNRVQGNFFYNNVTSSGVSTLNSFVIQASENGGAANAEIVSGQISFMRVSFSSVIQGGGDSADSLEVNTKLFNGGGITNLHFEVPFFYYNRQNILFYSAFKPGLVADIPVFGSELERDAFSGYADLALEYLIELRTDGGELSLFANFKGSYIAGTPTFYSTLKSPDSEIGTPKVTKPFWISQVYVGVAVSKRFRITANIPIATTRLIEMPDKIQIGIQVTPDSKK